MASRAQFAAHVGVTKPTVDDLIHRGIIKEHKALDGIDLDEARLDYVKHLRSKAGSRSGSVQSDLTLSKERARKAKEEADKLAMANAIARGQVLLRKDVDEAVIGAFSRVRARLLTVPSKTAAEVIAAGTPTLAEQIIREGIYEALEELADSSIEAIMSPPDEETA